MEEASAPLVIIRQMELVDIDAVKEIDELSFTLSWPRRAFQFEIQENPASSFYVAERRDPGGGKQVVGMIGLWLIVDEIHISTLAVHPNHRRQGIGKQLVAEALAFGHARGAVSATLEVRQSNLSAQDLYRKFGFQVVGRRPRYYKDNYEDAVLMTIPDLDKIEQV